MHVTLFICYDWSSVVQCILVVPAFRPFEQKEIPQTCFFLSISTNFINISVFLLYRQLWMGIKIRYYIGPGVKFRKAMYQ